MLCIRHILLYLNLSPYWLVTRSASPSLQSHLPIVDVFLLRSIKPDGLLTILNLAIDSRQVPAFEVMSLMNLQIRQVEPVSLALTLILNLSLSDMERVCPSIAWNEELIVHLTEVIVKDTSIKMILDLLTSDLIIGSIEVSEQIVSSCEVQVIRCAHQLVSNQKALCRMSPVDLKHVQIGS